MNRCTEKNCNLVEGYNKNKLLHWQICYYKRKSEMFHVEILYLEKTFIKPSKKPLSSIKRSFLVQIYTYPYRILKWTSTAGSNLWYCIEKKLFGYAVRKLAWDNKIVDGEMMIEKSAGEVLGLKLDYSC